MPKIEPKLRVVAQLDGLVDKGIVSAPGLWKHVHFGMPVMLLAWGACGVQLQFLLVGGVCHILGELGILGGGLPGVPGVPMGGATGLDGGVCIDQVTLPPLEEYISRRLQSVLSLPLKCVCLFGVHARLFLWDKYPPSPLPPQTTTSSVAL